MAHQPVRPAQEVALASVLDLPIAEQFEVLEKLANVLGTFRVPDKNVAMTSRQRSARRAAAMTCLQRVAEQLDEEHREAVEAARNDKEALPPPAAPGKLTRAAYDRLTQPLGLQLTGRQIIHVFGRWANATDVYHGHLTLRQAALKTTGEANATRLTAHNRYSVDQLVTGVQRFLAATAPDEPSISAYKTWVDEIVIRDKARSSKGRRAATQDGLAPAHAHTVMDRLRATWPHIIDLARGEITEADARHRTLTAAQAEPFVDRTGIAWILDLAFREVDDAIAQIDFPPPAVFVGSFKGWEPDDIRALAEERQPPNISRAPGWRTSEIMTSSEVGHAFGMKANAISKHLGRGNITRDGRIGHFPWWWRTSIDHLAVGLNRPVLHPPAASDSGRNPSR